MPKAEKTDFVCAHFFSIIKNIFRGRKCSFNVNLPSLFNPLFGDCELKDFFRKLFGIYPGEGTQALRFVRLAICVAFGSSCLDTLSDGLFLENIGAHLLPRVYMTIALGMIGVS